MIKFRKIKKVITPNHTQDGAGVKLSRVFGFHNTEETDPFLLLDEIKSDNEEDYIKGFPWHPHRGIETITYVLSGSAEHADSIGNKGVISEGDVQWMTGGSGVIHQEMPKGDREDKFWGLQLWANLPADSKMINPRYRDVKKETIPEIKKDNGSIVKIVCGDFEGANGPVKDIIINPTYLDIFVPANQEMEIPVNENHKVLIYPIQGKAVFEKDNNNIIDKQNLLIMEEGNNIFVKTDSNDVRFLLFSGKPLNEGIAWRGPIVMNTQEELDKAFEELNNGTFIK